MKASELRIGNWVMRKGRPYEECDGDMGKFREDEPIKIDNSISADGELCWNDYGTFHCESINEFYPIPLTEDILLKCGFEKCLMEAEEYEYKYSEYYSLYRHKCDVSFIVGDGEVVECWKNEGDDADLFELIYLHKLQNFVYETSGYEIEIKL